MTGEYELIGSKFWNMPISDLEGIGKYEWEKYQSQFINGIEFEIKDNRIGNNFIKI